MTRCLVPMLCLLATATAAEPQPLADARRVVFLGDSITHSGQYIEYVEAYLRLKNPGLKCEFLDLGLPSETVSGLSEPGHAGGSFPRPDLHERLARVLEKTKPDLIVACYGMNDGIYYPFGDDRFRKYRDGMARLREQAKSAGARVLHVTPPVFDPVPIKANTLPAGLAEYRSPYEGYDDVLNLYAAWLMAERANGWDVVDVHGPMKQFLRTERARDPQYRLAGDGVHINDVGHRLMAREILIHLGIPDADLRDATGGEPFLGKDSRGPELLKLVREKQRLLKDAWIADIGHQRPGMAKGMPLKEAREKAETIDAQIRTVLARTP